MENIDMAV